MSSAQPATQSSTSAPSTSGPSTSGSVEEFDRNWKERKETHYNHWVKGAPQNQIQLAFRNHWDLFSTVLQGRAMDSCLEVGSGRGSLSSYFADDGVECTLLDTSQAILDIAANIYHNNGHKAKFIAGNALDLPFPDNSFDVVTSIGLLEHFEDVITPLREQLRVLKPGGTCFAYIVPERPENVQKYFRWANRFLKWTAETFTSPAKKPPPKTDIFRSDFGSPRYLVALEGQNVTDIGVCGMYPLPMLSHSPEFPFSLLPKPVEWALTHIFSGVLWLRRKLLGNKLFYGHPWTCREEMGQAFLVTFRKGLN